MNNENASDIEVEHLQSRSQAMPMLILDKEDLQKELEFEVKCALTIKPEDRIKKLHLLSEHVLKLAGKYETRRPYQIIKRSAH
ncbi:MAG: hypothetical protein HQM15_02410 [Deltaproteobacteria bacterium]|nr:hypothetical protein [Deltaproteobacteria bacterium]